MEKQKMVYKRTCVLALLLLAMFGSTCFRLSDFQVVRGEELLKKAQNEVITVKTVPAARGTITDRYGRVLAASETSFRLILDRTFLEKEETNLVLSRLMKILSEEGISWKQDCPLEWKEERIQFSDADSANELADLLKTEQDLSAREYTDLLLKRYGLEKLTPTTFEILRVRYSMEKDRFVTGSRYPLAEKLTIQAVSRIEEEQSLLPGAEIEEVPSRVYQNGEVASQLIGTVGPIYQEEYAELKGKGYAMDDIVGKSGVESALEEQLRGQNGKIKVIQSKEGTVIDTVVQQETIAGSTVRLTIDALLQEKLQKRLVEFVSTAHSEEYRSKGGAIVVLDVKTGEVLAAVNSSNYSMEQYQEDYQALLQDDTKPLFNRALDGLYRPGSSLKPMVAAAALSEGKLLPQEELVCVSPYEYRDQKYTCLQTNHSGPTSLTEALHWSCNTFFYQLGQRLGIETMNEYAAYMGLGQKTGLEIQQAKGRFASPEVTESLGGTWYPGDLLQAAIGQNETAVSPIQMACEAMTIANRGTRYETHIIHSIQPMGGEEQITKPVIASEFELSETHYQVIEEGMELAAQKAGISGAAQKTGTAQTTSIRRVNNDFIGFYPLEEPQIAVSCIVEDCGGGTAKLLSDIISYYEECKAEGEILQNSQSNG